LNFSNDCLSSNLELRISMTISRQKALVVVTFPPIVEVPVAKFSEYIQAEVSDEKVSSPAIVDAPIVSPLPISQEPRAESNVSIAKAQVAKSSEDIQTVILKEKVSSPSPDKKGGISKLFSLRKDKSTASATGSTSSLLNIFQSFDNKTSKLKMQGQLLSGQTPMPLCIA
jgi:hypothetical protein